MDKDSDSPIREPARAVSNLKVQVDTLARLERRKLPNDIGQTHRPMFTSGSTAECSSFVVKVGCRCWSSCVNGSRSGVPEGHFLVQI